MRTLKAIPAAACAMAGAAFAAPLSLAYADSPAIIEGGNDDARDAIEALLPDREDPTTLFEAERIAEEAASRALAWLRAEGYYQGTAEPDASDNPPRARVVITLGPRFHFGQPTIGYITPPPAADAQTRVTDAIHLTQAGAPARAADVLAAEAAAVAALQDDGYPDAEAGERRVVVDHADASVTPAFSFDAGERVRLGALVAEPPDLFRDSFLRDLRNWNEGDEYTREHLQQLRRDMAATGAVARVSTRLEPTEAAGVRNVVLEIAPAKRNAYEFGAGYSTTEGLGIEAEWARRNYSRRADTLTLNATIGALAQNLSAELKRPHAAGLGRTVRDTVEVSREDTGPYVRQGASVSRAIEAARRLRLGISYGASLSYDMFDETAGVGDALVASAFGEVRRDTTGNPLDARTGDIIELRVEPSVSTGDATLAFVRSTADARVYRTFGSDEDLTLAARSRLGWIVAATGSDEDLPPDRRFYAGGGGSVRGYDYNSIYPDERKLDGVTPGGQGLLEVSAEARYRFGETLGAVAFIDGGNAFDDWGDAADLKWGVGVGARYDLGFAPLRIDVAVPLDPGPEDPDYALYVSLGQAF